MTAPRLATVAENVPPAALRLRDAARFIGMSPSWLAHSDVPRVPLTRRSTVYLVEDLKAYLTQRRTPKAA